MSSEKNDNIEKQLSSSLDELVAKFKKLDIEYLSSIPDTEKVPNFFENLFLSKEGKIHQ